MAKRARGTTTRPGQRRPIQRPPVRPAGAAPRIAPPPTTLTAAEEARAAELEAAIVAQEQLVESSRRVRQQRPASEAAPRSVSSLAVAAGSEYAYVARDIRRIVVVGGSLAALLAVLWVVVQITGITL